VSKSQDGAHQVGLVCMGKGKPLVTGSVIEVHTEAFY